MPEEIKPINSDEDFQHWQNKNIESHRQLILNQFEECRKQLSKDLREGGTYPIQTERGVVMAYFPDQREVDTQCITTLMEMMAWYSDEEAKKNINALEEDIDNAHEKYYKEYLRTEWYMPNVKRALKTRMIEYGNGSKVGEITDKKMEMYVLKKYRLIFVELNLLFKRKKELGGKRAAI